MKIVKPITDVVLFFSVKKGDVFHSDNHGYCMKIEPVADLKMTWTAVQLETGNLLALKDHDGVVLFDGRFVMENNGP